MHATIKHNPPFAGLRRSFANGFDRFKDAMVLVMESQARTRRIEYYQAKSDAELARLGLRREDIVRHVFRDVIHY